LARSHSVLASRVLTADRLPSRLPLPNPLRHTEANVPEFCTCGAELPPDARFCHKCGKPQRDEPVLVEEPPVVVPLPPPIQAPLPPIGFRNPLAFRVGTLSALLALVLTLLLYPAFPLWLAAAGFLGVYLYHRRSGESLSTRSGLKMGWITGLLTFLVFSLPAGFAYFEQITGPEYVKQMREQLGTWSFPAAMQEQMIAFMQTPLGIASQMVTLMLMLFVLLTILPLLGGVVAAKVLGRKQATGPAPPTAS